MLKKLKLLGKLPQFIRLLWGLFKDPRVPSHLKLLALGALAYIGVPLDITPDFIPLSGYLDDLVVSFLVIERFLASCPKDVLNEHFASIQLKSDEFTKDMQFLSTLSGKLTRKIRKELEPLLSRYVSKIGNRE